MSERIEFYQKPVSQQQEMINFLINSNSAIDRNVQVDRLERLVQALIKSLAGARKHFTRTFCCEKT